MTTATAKATADTAIMSRHVDDKDSDKQHGNDDNQDKDEADTTITRQRETHR